MMIKRFSIFTVVLTLLLIGCTSEPAAPTPSSESTAAVVEGGTSAVQPVVAANDFEVGTPRIPIIFFDGPSMSADVQEAEMTLFDLSQEPAERLETYPATNYSDYTVPYWVFRPEIETAGIYGIVARITLADGTTEDVQLTIQIEEENSAPLVGDKAIPSENRTLETEPDINKLSSGQDPNPALYQMTVAEAIESGRPTVVAFNTPAYCQTAICAPVLQSIQSTHEQYGDQANFIHLEIFKQFNPELIQADEVAEWNLPSEPWTFILDEEGVIQARLGGPVSPTELSTELQSVLNN